MNLNRVKKLNGIKNTSGPVLYWMQRDQRINDNWALIYAQQLALEMNTHLVIAFCLVPNFSEAVIRQFDFMLQGLKEVEKTCLKYKIPFKILLGSAPEVLPKFIEECEIGTIVTDFNPLKIISSWKSDLSKMLNISFYEVDAHNIVPCRIASDKQEYGAYTIRPKINRLLDTYLEPFPDIQVINNGGIEFTNDWEQIYSSLKVDTTVGKVDWILPGEEEALKALNKFVNTRLEHYGEKRNDPNEDFTSGLSPYFHFGQLAPQRAALSVQPLLDMGDSRDSFLEELIIRRELSDNFCFYNPDYDSFEGIHDWAKTTLNAHRSDHREYMYEKDAFEDAETHDPLWNAAQKEMVTTGKMHGYMRMYWAKKILEWTESPEKAFETAIYLNDKYQLDGQDPNGYTGVAWSVGGVHDRAWTERPVFGKIRYMNYNGCKRKFDVQKYIGKHLHNDQAGFNF